MADTRHISLDEVVLHFAELEDPRSTVNLQHPLVSVVVIALMAVLAGASGPTAIGKWAALKEEFLLNTLDLPNGIPRKDVFRRVLMTLRPGAFQACFANCRMTGYKDEKARPSTLKGRLADVRDREGPGIGSVTEDQAHDHLRRSLRTSRWSVIKGWHIARHSFASNCAAKGIDQRLIDRWLGHTTDEMHRRYQHLIPNHEQEAIGAVFG